MIANQLCFLNKKLAGYVLKTYKYPFVPIRAHSMRYNEKQTNKQTCLHFLYLSMNFNKETAHMRESATSAVNGKSTSNGLFSNHRRGERERAQNKTMKTRYVLHVHFTEQAYLVRSYAVPYILYGVQKPRLVAEIHSWCTLCVCVFVCSSFEWPTDISICALAVTNITKQTVCTSFHTFTHTNKIKIRIFFL